MNQSVIFGSLIFINKPNTIVLGPWNLLVTTTGGKCFIGRGQGFSGDSKGRHSHVFYFNGEKQNVKQRYRGY